MKSTVCGAQEEQIKFQEQRSLRTRWTWILTKMQANGRLSLAHEEVYTTSKGENNQQHLGMQNKKIG